MDFSTERGLLMLTLTMDTSDTLESPSDPPLVWTQSPRDLMPLPRDMLLMPTTAMDTMDFSTERGLLTLMLTTDTSDTLSLESPSDPPLVWTPSPRDLMLPPRDMLPMLITDTDSTTELTWVKF